MEFKFRNLRFRKAEKRLRVNFMEYFHFYLEHSELSKLGKYTAEKGTIKFDIKKDIEKRFYFLLQRGFDGLVSFSGKKAQYIHAASGIPLIGTNEFGIVDRGTNFIELKPITTCNIDCIYCSVDHCKRVKDFVVEEEYLVEELEKVITRKEHKVKIHIGGQGEPTMYSDIVKLVRDVRKIPKIDTISINTNGVLLDKKLADRLLTAGLTHFHISINALDEENANRIAQVRYPLKRVRKIAGYLAKKAKVMIVPVWVPSINDDEMAPLVEFSKKIGANIGIQNYLNHKLGKRPVNPLPMKVFYERLRLLSEKMRVDLTKVDEGLSFEKDTPLGRPFRKNEIVNAQIVGTGRLPKTAIAVAKDRCITVIDCNRKNGNVKVKLIRDKDSIFNAIIV